MSLPSAVISALRRLDDLSPICITYPWGTVTRNPSLPLVFDANHAWVVEGPAPSLGELREAMASVQVAAPVPYTHVEVVDLDACPDLVVQLTSWLVPPPDVFAVMALSSTDAPDPGPPPPGITVTERPFPDLEQWLALIHAGHADEPPLPEAVLHELATRDTSVFAPAGRRFFAGERVGHVVAYASLLSVDGVGLIDNVATLPAHRRQGAAAAVVSATIAASTAAGNEHTILFTHSGSAAERVYERLGLRTVATAAQFHSELPATF